jgi:Flp pilus assembly protein TadG
VNIGEKFSKQTNGASAVEFALVFPILIATILFLMSIGYVLFMGQALDYATQKAARQIKTGQVQTAGLTQTQFQTNVVCPLLPSLFSCSNVIVNLQTIGTINSVPNDSNYPNEYLQFVNSSSTGLNLPPLSTQTAYNPGQGQCYVYLQIVYPVPLWLAALSSSTAATTLNGQKVYLIMATATFLNEPFTVVASC